VKITYFLVKNCFENLIPLGKIQDQKRDRFGQLSGIAMKLPGCSLTDMQTRDGWIMVQILATVIAKIIKPYLL